MHRTRVTFRVTRHPESVGSHLGVTFHKRTSGQRIRESVLGLGSELPFTHEARNTVTELMAHSRRGPGSIGRNRFDDKLTPRFAKATFDSPMSIARRNSSSIFAC